MKYLFEALLLMMPGIGKTKLAKLTGYFGDAQTAWRSSATDLRGAGLLSSAEIDELLLQRKKLEPETVAKAWDHKGIRICCISGGEYPKRLQACFDPPPLLFYRGQMPTEDFCLAVVGSRRSTPYGRNVARSFCEALARAGVTIVSGAARGIDTAAHEGALAATEGRTVAVLGCGVDVVYPPENARLLDKIAESGCILSEYPPGTPPAPGRFPARNRIVAGLSVGVLVVEAGEKSGALITADLALEENRDVYAIPGSVFSEASRGTHRLIQQGARLVVSVQDLLEELRLPGEVLCGQAVRLTAVEQKVLSVLDFAQARSVDEVIRVLGLEAAAVQVILLQLELAGQVEKDVSRRYIRLARE